MRRGWFTAATAATALLTAACAPAPDPLKPVGPPYPEPVTGLSSGCTATALPAAPTHWVVESDGIHRGATLRLPPGARPGEPLPLLLSLHPFSAEAEAWEGYSGLANAATSRGYAVLSPQGLRFADAAPRWTARGGFGGGPDDTAFIARLLDRAESELCLDRGRVHAAGFSAGAAFAHTLSCELPHRVVAVAGSGGMNLSLPCPEGAPTSAMVLHGTVDPIVPLTGSTTAPPTGINLDTVTASFASRAGCTGTPAVTTPLPNTTVRSFGTCGDERVVEVRIAGMGHTWAGSTQFSIIEGIVGPSVNSPDANTLILDFLDTRGR